MDVVTAAMGFGDLCPRKPEATSFCRALCFQVNRTLRQHDLPATGCDLPAFMGSNNSFFNCNTYVPFVECFWILENNGWQRSPQF